VDGNIGTVGKYGFGRRERLHWNDEMNGRIPHTAVSPATQRLLTSFLVYYVRTYAFAPCTRKVRLPLFAFGGPGGFGLKISIADKYKRNKRPTAEKQFGKRKTQGKAPTWPGLTSLRRAGWMDIDACMVIRRRILGNAHVTAIQI
jgi:hypothetical protein